MSINAIPRMASKTSGNEIEIPFSLNMNENLTMFSSNPRSEGFAVLGVSSGMVVSGCG
jgi:hypothetical protein